MRDSPLSLSVAQFAAQLHCGVDTAKRWLAGTTGMRWTQTKKSSGGHWAVELPHGDYSILACRLQRSLDKIFDRKPYASIAMPLDLGTNEEGQTVSGDWDILCGIKAPWMRQDLEGLFSQVATELKQPLEALLHESEKKMTDALAWLILLQAAMRLRKPDKSLTVSALAKTLNMSVASLYRKPFGQEILEEVLLVAERRMSAPAISESEALASGLNQRSRKEARTYGERKPGRDRARKAKARHFLCWYAVDWPEGRQATLRLVPEVEVPFELRPSYPKPPLRSALPKYSAADLRGIFTWLERHAILEGESMANVSPNQSGNGYRWHFNGGQYHGQAESWELAADSASRLTKEVRFRRGFLILNPVTENDLFEIPIYLSGQQQEPVGPVEWVSLERDTPYENEEMELREITDLEGDKEPDENRARERGVLFSSRGISM